MKIGSRSLQVLIAAAVFFAPFVANSPKLALADSVSVSPPRFELLGSPGDTVTEKIRVGNDSTIPITYQTQVDNFTPSGDEGGVNLIDDLSQTTSISLAQWITVEPSRFTVQPNDEKLVTFTIKIPKNAEPGGHYASILIRRAGDKVDGGATIDTRVGSLILLKVSGNVKEELSVDTFKSEDNYYQYGPVKFVLRTTNNGNVHVAPTGKIVISDMFGKKVTELDLSRANVLPTSSRSIKTEWSTKNLVGRYTATLVANYGSNNQSLSATTTFIVIPIPLVAGILIVLLIIFLLIKYRRSFKKLINRLTAD